MEPRNAGTSVSRFHALSSTTRIIALGADSGLFIAKVGIEIEALLMSLKIYPY